MKPKKKLVALYAEISDMLVEIHDRLAMIDDGARKLVLSSERKKQNANVRWTKNDDRFLREHAGKWKVQVLAHHLKREVPAVRTHASSLGISLKKQKHIRVVRAAA
jgi:hypothetical protein